MASSSSSRATEGKITRQIMKTRSGEFDIESIHSMVLRNQGIGDLGCIGECLSIERLDLSRNDVTKLYNLAGLSNLAYLNLSANRITSLEGLQSLENLKTLNLAGNLIGSVDSLRCLMGLEKLEDLRLCDIINNLTNPVCMNNIYRTNVLNVLPKLSVLDGERLSGPGSEVFKMCTEIEAALNSLGAKSGIAELSPSGPWIKPELWEPSKTFEKTSLADTDKQLQDLLVDSKRIIHEGDVKIQKYFQQPSEAGDS